MKESERLVNHFLDRFFWPRSIALVGATNNSLKINYHLTRNLIDLKFKGRIYPVNTHSKEIDGIRAFPRLQDIPDKIDLAVSAVPASKTMDVVRECDLVGIKRLVIVTGGFSEGGEQGKKLHQEIASFVKEREIRTLGPNTLSPINTSNHFSISFNQIKKMKRGGLSFAFQSGFYDPKIDWLCSHLGINKILDMGNKIDINEVDALEYFSKDPDTRVIGMHIESLHGNGPEFFELLKAVSLEKPTIILKSGRTQAGSLAAASHTGALAREDDVIFDGMIKQTSAIRAQNMDEFFDLTKAFEFLELPKGNRISIIVLSGGEGVLATDACEVNGLELADLKDRTYNRLKRIFPPWKIPLNPLDAGVCIEFNFSDLPGFYKTLAAIPADENVDCTIMQMPPHLLVNKVPSGKDASKKEKFTQMFLDTKGNGNPFALWCTSMDRHEMELVDIIESHNMPVFQSSERAIKALSAMCKYRLRSSPDRVK